MIQGLTNAQVESLILLRNEQNNKLKLGLHIHNALLQEKGYLILDNGHYVLTDKAKELLSTLQDKSNDESVWNEAQRILNDPYNSLGTKLAYMKTKYNLTRK